MKVAVIPARGGSKRIPGKNIRRFAGKPIIAYSIEAAKSADVFDRVIVSTDDESIASVAREYGAETPFMRPKILSDDFTGTNAVVKHALECLREETEDLVEYACCIYATAPFMDPGNLRRGLEVLLESGSSFAFSVTTYSFPIQRALRLNCQGAIEPFQGQYIDARSQDLEPAYHDAAQFYWGRADAYLNGVTLYSPASVPVILPRYLVQDIDTPEDWEMAELMYKALRMKEKGV